MIKLLFSKKTVKSTKELILYALEKATEEKLTLSEKMLKKIIEHIIKEKKTQFIQRDGWKIQI